MSARAREFVNAHPFLQAIHLVTSRADVCSVRFCETSLRVLELLFDLGLVSTPATSPVNAANSCNKDEAIRVDEELSRQSHGVDRFDIFIHLFHATVKFKTSIQSVSARRVPSRLRRFRALFIFRHYTLPRTTFDGPQLHRISGKYFRSRPLSFCVKR